MSEEPLVRMVGIVKRFGAVEALKGVDFEVFPKEIVGLVGDNGAGKSTLMKILTGAYSADRGEIFFEGERVHFTSPLESRERGIEMIYQDLALAEDVDIAGNIFLGREPRKRSLFALLLGLMDLRTMHAEAKRILGELETTITSTKQKVRVLSGGQRKAVAIARATYWNAKLIIMDEPTAALAIFEVQKVLELVRKLRERGIAVIFISHNLQEVFAVADRIVVLRSGELAGVRRTCETSQEEIAQLMIVGKGRNSDGKGRVSPL